MSDENLIDEFCERIKTDKNRLERNELERIKVESFKLSEFWTQFNASVLSLNNEVTKVGFLCGKRPFPSVTVINSVIQDLLQHYTVMRDLYLVLSEDVGYMLFKSVTAAVIEIMTTFLDFVQSLHNLSEKGAKDRLTLTGTFWDACNAVDSLPRDNLQATRKVLDNEVDLALDAQEELETVSTCAEFDDVKNDDQDKINVSVKSEENKSDNINLKIKKESSTKSNDTLNQSGMASEVKEHAQGNETSKFILAGDNDFQKNASSSSSKILSDCEQIFRLVRDIESPSDSHSEFNMPKSDEEVMDNEMSYQLSDGSPSEFIVLDEVLEDEDDNERTSNFESTSTITSMSNNYNEVEKNRKFNKAEELTSELEGSGIDCGNKTNKLKNCTSLSSHLSVNINESHDAPLFRKDLYLSDQVPERRFNGSMKRRRKKYLEEVSESLLKDFESDDLMKGMEAMVLNVPKRFIDSCDSFTISKVMDNISKHNQTLNTGEWVVHTHWVGDAQQLSVLIIVDKESMQTISASDGVIYLSKDIKAGIRKFIPIVRKKSITSVSSESKTSFSFTKNTPKAKSNQGLLNNSIPPKTFFEPVLPAFHKKNL